MRQVERQNWTALVRQVQALQEALDRAQEGDLCARHGCRLGGVPAAGGARAQAEYDAQGTPWRDSEWEHPLVQRLRAKTSEQAGELDRLREENGLLRRWVSQHVDPGQPGTAGA